MVKATGDNKLTAALDALDDKIAAVSAFACAPTLV